MLCRTGQVPINCGGVFCPAPLRPFGKIPLIEDFPESVNIASGVFFSVPGAVFYVKIDVADHVITQTAEIDFLTNLPLMVSQNSRSVASAHLSAPVGIDYPLAYALRQLAASYTGYPLYLLAPEVSVLLDAVGSVYRRTLFDLMWNTGARINEALAVTPEDIVLDAPRPYVVLHTLKQRIERRNGRPPKKNPVKRAVPLLDDAFTLRLRDHLATFTRHQTKPVWDITDDTARNWLNEALTDCQRRGLRFSISTITPKTLRHSFAMHLAMNGALPVTLQAYMGHRDFKSTQHYLKVFALDVGIGRERGVQFTYPVNGDLLLQGDIVTK